MSIERSRRMLFRASAAGVLLGLSACTQIPIQPQDDASAHAEIRAEDVEQIDIQEVNSRQRAASELCEAAGRCSSSGVFGQNPD